MCDGVLETSDDKRISFAESDDNFRADDRENERVLCDFRFQMSNYILVSPIRFRSNTTENPRVRKSGVMDGGVRSSVLGGELW